MRVKEVDTFQGVSFSFAIFAGRMYGLFDEMHLDVNGYLMSLQSVECSNAKVCCRIRYLLSNSIRYQSISRRHIVRRRKEVHFAG